MASLTTDVCFKGQLRSSPRATTPLAGTVVLKTERKVCPELRQPYFTKTERTVKDCHVHHARPARCHRGAIKYKALTLSSVHSLIDQVEGMKVAKPKARPVMNKENAPFCRPGDPEDPPPNVLQESMFGRPRGKRMLDTIRSRFPIQREQYRGSSMVAYNREEEKTKLQDMFATTTQFTQSPKKGAETQGNAGEDDCHSVASSASTHQTQSTKRTETSATSAAGSEPRDNVVPPLWAPGESAPPSGDVSARSSLSTSARSQRRSSTASVASSVSKSSVVSSASSVASSASSYQRRLHRPQTASGARPTREAGSSRASSRDSKSEGVASSVAKDYVMVERPDMFSQILREVRDRQALLADLEAFGRGSQHHDRLRREIGQRVFELYEIDPARAKKERL